MLRGDPFTWLIFFFTFIFFSGIKNFNLRVKKRMNILLDREKIPCGLIVFSLSND